MDLKARGLLENTWVLWGGEFGRTPTAEGTNGREQHSFGRPPISGRTFFSPESTPVRGSDCAAFQFRSSSTQCAGGCTRGSPPRNGRSIPSPPITRGLAGNRARATPTALTRPADQETARRQACCSDRTPPRLYHGYHWATTTPRLRLAEVPQASPGPMAVNTPNFMHSTEPN